MSTPDDTALGKILRELGEIRTDIGAMREHSDQRHKTLADEMHAVREMVRRAEHIANDAKQLAERTASDSLTIQRAVMDHTKGLVDRVARVETSNDVQNTKLDTLVNAAAEQKIREDERAKLEAATWKRLERWKQVGTYVWPAVAAVAGYLLHHWKP